MFPPDEMTLYHVSLRENEASILSKGVLAVKSKGHRTGSYWVHEDMLIWAVLHVSARHSVSVNEILIFVGVVPLDDIQRTARPGVFFVPTDIPVNYTMDVPLDRF